MPRNARYVLPGRPYHVTQRGNNRQDVFFSDQDREVYLDLVRANLADAGVRIFAYCLMTNHVHWIAVPARGDSLAVLFRRVHGRYAQYLNTRRRASGHLWQARFFSCVLSPAHLDVALRYVERNPVRALMTATPEAYPWSSAAAHIADTVTGDGFLDPTIWHDLGGSHVWREMLNTPDSAPLAHLFRRCTYSERPFGDEAFVQSIEAQTGRKWKRYNYAAELKTADLALQSLRSLAHSTGPQMEPANQPPSCGSASQPDQAAKADSTPSQNRSPLPSTT